MHKYKKLKNVKLKKIGYLEIMDTTRNPQNNKKASNYIDTHA